MPDAKYDWFYNGGKYPDLVGHAPSRWRRIHPGLLRTIGECSLGWKGADVTNTGDGDEYFLWMFNQGTIYENLRLTSPEQAHMLFQLYNNQQRNNASPVGNDAVRRFAQRFYKSHPAPDWIEFKDLRPGDPVTKTFQVGNSPVAGSATRVANQLTETVTPWTWSDVVWRYNNGQSVIYPAFGTVDWTRP